MHILISSNELFITFHLMRSSAWVLSCSDRRWCIYYCESFGAFLRAPVINPHDATFSTVTGRRHCRKLNIPHQDLLRESIPSISTVSETQQHRTWPSGKLLLNVKKIAQNLTFFQNNCQKLPFSSKKLPSATNQRKLELTTPFATCYRPQDWC